MKTPSSFNKTHSQSGEMSKSTAHPYLYFSDEYPVKALKNFNTPALIILKNDIAYYNNDKTIFLSNIEGLDKEQIKKLKTVCPKPPQTTESEQGNNSVSQAPIFKKIKYSDEQKLFLTEFNNYLLQTLRAEEAMLESVEEEIKNSSENKGENKGDSLVKRTKTPLIKREFGPIETIIEEPLEDQNEDPLEDQNEIFTAMKANPKAFLNLHQNSLRAAERLIARERRQDEVLPQTQVINGQDKRKSAAHLEERNAKRSAFVQKLQKKNSDIVQKNKEFLKNVQELSKWPIEEKNNSESSHRASPNNLNQKPRSELTQLPTEANLQTSEIKANKKANLPSKTESEVANLRKRWDIIFKKGKDLKKSFRVAALKREDLLEKKEKLLTAIQNADEKTLNPQKLKALNHKLAGLNKKIFDSVKIIQEKMQQYKPLLKQQNDIISQMVKEQKKNQMEEKLANRFFSKKNSNKVPKQEANNTPRSGMRGPR